VSIDHTHPALQGQVTENGKYQVCPASSPVNCWVDSFWQLTVGWGEYVYRSVPDNCVDLIFNLDELSDAFIVTPFLSPIEFPISGPVKYFGIRFSALGYQGLIKAPLGEWLNPDCHVNAHEMLQPLVIEHIQKTLSQGNNFLARTEGVAAALLVYLKHPKLDHRLLRFIHSALDPNFGDLGVSPRQLRRISQLHLGLSPKEFARVTRFQATLQQLSTCSPWPVWPQFYYDQSHFIREFKNFAGATPASFLKMSVLYKKTQTSSE